MTILAAVFLAAGAVGAIGAIQQGQAAKASGDFQQGVLDQQAAGERDKAGADAEDFRSRGGRARASSLARLGASGAGATGSPLLVDEAFVKNIALGSARIAQGGDVRAQRLGQQGTLSAFQGRSARTGSFFSAGSSLLSGLGGAIGTAG